MENPFINIDKKISNVENLLTEFIKSQHPKEEKLHSVKSLAVFADVSQLTVRNWIDDGKIKAKKIGGVIRIHESQFMNGLEEVKSLKHKR